MGVRGSIALLVLTLAGCSALPQVAHEPRYHNPFPQLTRVAVLPFFNQSAEPTVDQDQVALAYYNELQQIPGFEVVPVGVTKQLLLAWQRSRYAAGAQPPWPRNGSSTNSAGNGAPAANAALPEPMTGDDFQQLAQVMGVDAIVVGSVTEFSPYYPPRMGLSVRWYAANPGFYPIPPGYGLPWGTAQEEFIPDSLVWEAEHALAREQLKTQTPTPPSGLSSPVGAGLAPGGRLAENAPTAAQPLEVSSSAPGADLPPDWPDPRGFVPPPPSPQRPPCQPQHEPVLSHTRLYHGNDADFTQRLANYYFFRDEARFGGWQAYLQRSEDFTRFCCHLHITEMLAARGGAGKTRVVWRWPIGRYEP